MNIKSKDGSIALFVFIAVLFIAGALLLMFTLGTNKSETIDKQLEILNSIYTSPNNNLNVIYNEINKENNNSSNVAWLSGTEKTAIAKTNLKIEEKEEIDINIKGYITQKIEENNFRMPLPEGFYYVGGTIETGLVISDDANDAGRGTINEDNLVGNQFVWIPISGTEIISIYENTSINENIRNSVNLYAGFFIGRYITKIDTAGNIVIKNTGIDYTEITDQIAQNKYTSNVNSYLCIKDFWNLTVNFIKAKNSDWMTNPKNNIYTTGIDSANEPYAYRMILAIQV